MLARLIVFGSTAAIAEDISSLKYPCEAVSVDSSVSTSIPSGGFSVVYTESVGFTFCPFFANKKATLSPYFLSFFTL